MPGAAGSGSDQDGVVGILETFFDIGRGHNPGQQREGGIVQFHDDSLERVNGRRNFNQLQDDRLVGAEQVARGDAKAKLIADLAGCTGNGDARGSVHENSPWVQWCQPTILTASCTDSVVQAQQQCYRGLSFHTTEPNDESGTSLE